MRPNMPLKQQSQAIINKLKQYWRAFNREQAYKPPVQYFVRLGITVVVVFIGGFLLWANLATLDSAAIAQGQIISQSKNKTIEHLEGGVVKNIHVKDGQIVTKDQFLITLDPAKPQAQYDVYHKEYLHLLAEKSRLVAERDNLKHIDWPADLKHVESIKSIQLRLLKANQRSIKSQLIILKKQVAQLKNEIKNYHARVKSEGKQLKLINQEVEVVAELERKKLIELPKLLALKREAARLAGLQEQYLGQVASTEQKIGEIKQKIITLQDEYFKKTIEELKDVTQKLAEVHHKLEAAHDVLKRTTIKAPIAGTVLGLTQFTVGGVITPGETLLQIVPSQDKLIAEVQVGAADIESVHVKQKARVYILAFKQRNTPTLNGTVSYVSADSYKDEKDQQVYYKALITIDDKELKKLNLKKLYPGMQVNAMIIIANRSPMDYFLTPLIESFRYAMREQ